MLKIKLCYGTFLACAITLSQAASHDVEWIYGMTENELCVAPGETLTIILNK